MAVAVADSAAEAAIFAGPDFLDRAAALAADDPIRRLRALRPAVARHSQGSFEALFDPAETHGLARIERDLVALRVARLNAHDGLAALHRGRALAAGAKVETLEAAEHHGIAAALPERLKVLLRHAELLTLHPAEARPEDLARLRAVGLSPAAAVSLSQLTAFANYAARVLAGLALLASDPVASHRS